MWRVTIPPPSHLPDVVSQDIGKPGMQETKGNKKENEETGTFYDYTHDMVGYLYGSIEMLQQIRLPREQTRNKNATEQRLFGCLWNMHAKSKFMIFTILMAWNTFYTQKCISIDIDIILITTKKKMGRNFTTLHIKQKIVNIPWSNRYLSFIVLPCRQTYLPTIRWHNNFAFRWVTQPKLICCKWLEIEWIHGIRTFSITQK